MGGLESLIVACWCWLFKLVFDVVASAQFHTVLGAFVQQLQLDILSAAVSCFNLGFSHVRISHPSPAVPL